MNGPELLSQSVGRVVTRMGACFVGSHAVFRGKDIHVDLLDAGWFDLFVYGITGRRFSPAELRLLEAIFVYTSYPDPRIWNNRVAALAGTARSTGNLGLAAALAVTEAGIYGQGPCLRACDFIIRTRAAVVAGADLGTWVRRELDERRGLGGYGRPLSASDERIEPVMDLARSLGLADGPHVKLAFEIDEYLSAHRLRMRINYAAVVGALTADMGFSAWDNYFYLFPVFLAGMVPCYLEAKERPEGTLFPLPCRGVEYRGVPKRRWKGP
jgi:hypothetical protein